MGRTRKFDYQGLIEAELTAQPDGLRLDDILARCALNVDRSTLFRHLSRLIEAGRIEHIGKARASRYRWIGGTGISADPATPDNPPSMLEPALEPTDRHAPTESAIPAQGDSAPLHLTDSTAPEARAISVRRYEAVVQKAVRTVVREWKSCSRVNLRIYLSLLVDPEQLESVAAVVESELAGLHEGNLSAYGLTLGEYAGFTPPEATGDEGTFPP
jgi:hypothetical protein